MELKNKAIAALVCGILAVISVFTGYGALLGLILGIVGIVLSVNVKKEIEAYGADADTNPATKDIRGMATAALICSIVGTAIADIDVLCVACAIATIGVAGCAMA